MMKLIHRPQLASCAILGPMLVALLLQSVFVSGKEPHASSAASMSKAWFHPKATLQPLTLHALTQTIHAVTVAGVTNGWIFQTDQVPPTCKGKCGEIVLLVGLNTNRLIMGTEVIQHQETPKYFSRLKESFYRQFAQRSVEAKSSDIDTVTSATRSSKAIREEVLLGSRVITSQPEVSRQMVPAPQKKKKP